MLNTNSNDTDDRRRFSSAKLSPLPEGTMELGSRSLGFGVVLGLLHHYLHRVRHSEVSGTFISSALVNTCSTPIS